MPTLCTDRTDNNILILGVASRVGGAKARLVYARLTIKKVFSVHTGNVQSRIAEAHKTVLQAQKVSKGLKLICVIALKPEKH